MSFDVASTLNACIHRQGLKFDVESWLDMGSKEWGQIEAPQKAQAYQAALCCGWTDQGLTALMISKWGPRIDEEWAKITLDTLKNCLKEFPVEVEEVRSTAPVKETVFRKGGDQTAYTLG